jgi:hypothetical protein
MHHGLFSDDFTSSPFIQFNVLENGKCYAHPTGQCLSCMQLLKRFMQLNKNKALLQCCRVNTIFLSSSILYKEVYAIKKNKALLQCCRVNNIFLSLSILYKQILTNCISSCTYQLHRSILPNLKWTTLINYIDYHAILLFISSTLHHERQCIEC